MSFPLTPPPLLVGAPCLGCEISFLYIWVLCSRWEPVVPGGFVPISPRGGGSENDVPPGAQEAG